MEKNLPARRRSPLVLFLAALTVAVLAALPATALAGAGVVTGNVPSAGMNVALMAATPGGKAPVKLGSTRSGRDGAFTLRYSGASDTAVKYLLATRPGGGAEAGFPVAGQT